MEVQDGFILGIFNYCDRWCARCRFTSRCGLFADVAKHEAALDPTLKAVMEAPPHPSDVRETPGWMDEILSEINVASLTAARAPEPTLPVHHREMIERAVNYGERVFEWLKANHTSQAVEATDPVETIAWFAYQVGAKVRRALTGLAEFDGDREFPPDHEGSAKLALIGIERSLAAWNDLAGVRRVSEADVVSFVSALEWLRNEVDQAVPKARAFVRPGFDEPEQVNMLEALER
jgi:hypothetical protein